MSRTIRALAPVLLVLVCAGCSGRERTNPFDPANPATRGEPAAARAAAACGRVDLAWNDEGMQDVRAFRLHRAAPAAVDSVLTPEPLGRAARAFRDTTVANGVVYRYRVEFVFDEGSAFTSPVDARPGPALPWCADPCGSGAALLAPDGGAVRAIVAEGEPIYDIDIDPQDHRVFAADPIGGGLLVFASDGAGPIREIAVAGATSVSWSGAARALAVGAFFESRVTWLRDDGTVLGSLSSAGALPRYPEDVALRDSSCTWVALSDASRSRGMLLRARLAAGAPDSVALEPGRPVALADDPAGGGCWVADRTGAVLYVTDGMEVRRSAAGEMRDPTDVAADMAGGCWVADRAAGALLLVDRSAAIVRRIGGLPGVVGVGFDPGGTLWAAQPDEQRVVCLDAASGDVIGSVPLSGCPIDVVGDWAGGCRR
jgi:hypothetical protein